jgi:hypothetical protein
MAFSEKKQQSLLILNHSSDRFSTRQNDAKLLNISVLWDSKLGPRRQPKPNGILENKIDNNIPE